MKKDEFINSELYIGKILFIDSATNVLWSEELLSINSKKAKASYIDMPSDVTLLIFGQETSGFPDEIFDRYGDYFYRIYRQNSGRTYSKD